MVPAAFQDLGEKWGEAVGKGLEERGIAAGGKLCREWLQEERERERVGMGAEGGDPPGDSRDSKAPKHPGAAVSQPTAAGDTGDTWDSLMGTAWALDILEGRERESLRKRGKAAGKGW